LCTGNMVLRLRLVKKSRMMGDYHVRFCERFRGAIPLYLLDFIMVRLDINNAYDVEFGKLYLLGFWSDYDYISGRNYFNSLSDSEKEAHLGHKPKVNPSKIVRFLDKVLNKVLYLRNSYLLKR